MRKAVIFDGALTDDSAGIDGKAILAQLTDEGYCVLTSMSEQPKISIVLDRDDVLALCALWSGRPQEVIE